MEVIKLRPNLALFFVVAVCIFLRLVSLGYSEYQGDETQALYLPKADQTMVQFLLSQKKGPVQYLITAAIKAVSGGYSNTFLTRLPFALAGVLAGMFFYLVVRNITDSTTALFSLAFYATNGMFVAFSRIVQYQTFVVLFITVSLYFAQLFYKTSRFRYLYAAFGMWCLGLLTHSDAMFIAFPLLFIFIAWANQRKLPLSRCLKTFSPPLFFLIAVLLCFYIPLILNSSSGTQKYWLGRFSGNITSGVISSSYLFSVYQPIYGLQIYELLGIFGIIIWLLAIASKYPITSRIVIKNRSLSDYGKYFDQSSPIIFMGVFLWFISSLVFMEVLTKFPGTHIWSYLLPLCVFMGYGLSRLYLVFTPKSLKLLYTIVVFILFSFLCAQSFYIFVDHKKEYPWERKTVIFWELAKPRTDYQLSLFGFPYNRRWEDIADFVRRDGKSAYYWDNEKASLSRYYMPLERNNEKAGYYIRINRPQTFTGQILNNRGASWIVLNQPIKVFYSKEGRQVASIYLVPEAWGK